jgi:hypothetical protein
MITGALLLALALGGCGGNPRTTTSPGSTTGENNTATTNRTGPIDGVSKGNDAADDNEDGNGVNHPPESGTSTTQTSPAAP